VPAEACDIRLQVEVLVVNEFEGHFQPQFRSAPALDLGAKTDRDGGERFRNRVHGFSTDPSVIFTFRSASTCLDRRGSNCRNIRDCGAFNGGRCRH